VSAPRTRLERLLASWWIVLALIPVGFVAWGALVYAGIRARRPLWIGFGVGYLALLTLGFLLDVPEAEEERRQLDDVGIGIVVLTWGATIVHSLAIRSAYLERLELLEGRRYDAAEDRVEERREARRLVQEEPAKALEMGVGRPDREGFSGGLVDLNNAPASVIEELPGVSRDVAERIVSVREEVGGFSSLEDLGHVLDLPVALVDRIRADVVLLPRGTPG
jgi:competence ComEA-like helix-hairpin-helix protein